MTHTQVHEADENAQAGIDKVYDDAANTPPEAEADSQFANSEVKPSHDITGDEVKVEAALRTRIAELESDLDETLELLRDLADIQNGPPLVQYEKAWNEIMVKVYAKLESKNK
jgi:hypothetical protein